MHSERPKIYRQEEDFSEVLWVCYVASCRTGEAVPGGRKPRTFFSRHSTNRRILVCDACGGFDSLRHAVIAWSPRSFAYCSGCCCDHRGSRGGGGAVLTFPRLAWAKRYHSSRRCAKLISRISTRTIVGGFRVLHHRKVCDGGVWWESEEHSRHLGR